MVLVFWQEYMLSFQQIIYMTNSTSAFSVDEVFKASFAMAKKNWMKFLMLIGVMILIYVAYAAIAYILFVVVELPGFLNSIIQILLGVYASIFTARGTLVIARDQKLEIGEILKLDAKTFLHALGASIIVYIVTVLGFILLIVPGIIASIMFGYCIYSIVDKKTEFIQSLEDSMHMTQGNKMKIFLYQLLLGLVGMVLAGIPIAAITVMAIALGSGTHMEPMVIMAISVLLMVVIVLPIAVYLGMVGMSGQAYMYLKMRAKTPVHLKK